MTPASAMMHSPSMSISRILFMRESETTTCPPLASGTCPPTSPVLPPCGMMGVFVSLASFRMAETSAVEPGFRTRGDLPWKRSRFSVRCGAMSCGEVSACFSPVMAANWVMRACGSMGGPVNSWKGPQLTPPSACRHLPREEGDRCPAAFPFPASLQERGKAVTAAISPLAGEMPTGRGGRLALNLPSN